MVAIKATTATVIAPTNQAGAEITTPNNAAIAVTASPINAIAEPILVTIETTTPTAEDITENIVETTVKTGFKRVKAPTRIPAYTASSPNTLPKY